MSGKLIFAKETVQLDRSRRRPIAAVRREWRLLQALLARESVHWLDGFLIFPTWLKSRPLGDYRNNFMSVKDRVGNPLGTLQAKGAWVTESENNSERFLLTGERPHLILRSQ